jgi:hypothetical protein
VESFAFTAPLAADSFLTQSNISTCGTRLGPALTMTPLTAIFIAPSGKMWLVGGKSMEKYANCLLF